ncbi:MAG: hypothetical protein Q4F95_02330 [Oscillospiraceae bacterium]|nr:hypothetical protein [Oscillospiraceae bacterium]
MANAKNLKDDDLMTSFNEEKPPFVSTFSRKDKSVRPEVVDILNKYNYKIVHKQHYKELLCDAYELSCRTTPQKLLEGCVCPHCHKEISADPKPRFCAYCGYEVIVE